jgi:hypothetical protein
MTRPKNRLVPLPPLKVPMTAELRRYLEDIVDTELVGSTPPQVALAFIREGVRRMIDEESIDRRSPKKRARPRG